MVSRTSAPSRRPAVAFGWVPLLVAVWVGVFSTVASGQDASEAPVLRSLETTTVTGSRSAKRLLDSPVSEAVVTPEQMERSTQDSPAEVLRDLPGVDVVDSSLLGMKRIRIRGEDSVRVLILVDGQEITDHRSYGSPMLIDNDLVERIEIIKGPHSVLYGARAVGGVVNFISKKGGGRPLEGTISVAHDTSSRGIHPSLLLSGTQGNFEYRVFSSALRYGDRKSPVGRLDNTSFRNDSLALYGAYEAGDHRIALSWDKFDLDTESHTDPSVLTETLTGFQLDMPRRDRQKFALFYDWEDVTDVLKKIHVDAYVQRIDRIFVQDVSVVPGFPFSSIDSHISTSDRLSTHGATLQADWRPREGHLLITGYQYLRDEVSQAQTQSAVMRRLVPPPVITTSAHYRDTMSQLTNAAFAQHEWNLSPRWVFTGGLRHYWVESNLRQSNHLASKSSSDTKLVGAMSLVFRGSENLSIRASLAQGYVYPTLLQQITGTGHGSGSIVHGNPGLEAERSDNFELGLRYQGDVWTIDSALYLTRAKDYIATARCTGANQPVPGCVSGGPQGPESYFVNLNEARTYGAELYVQREQDHWIAAPYVNISVLRRRIEDRGRSTNHSGMPWFSGRIGLRHERELRHDLALWLDGYLRTATGAKYESFSDGSIDRFGGWTTFNLSLGLDLRLRSRFRLALDLNNLTNKKYMPATESVLREGRSLVARVSADF